MTLVDSGESIFAFGVDHGSDPASFVALKQVAGRWENVDHVGTITVKEIV